MIFWDGEDVYVLPHEDSIGKPNNDCRFLWLPSYDDSDVDVVDYPQAVEVSGRYVGFHRHFGHVPRALLDRAKKDAGGTETWKTVKTRNSLAGIRGWYGSLKNRI